MLTARAPGQEPRPVAFPEVLQDGSVPLRDLLPRLFYPALK
jgi:hypothetical protein